MSETAKMLALDTMRRLDEIRTLLTLVNVMKAEPRRAAVIVDLRQAVKELARLGNDDHDSTSRLVMAILRLIARLEEANDANWDEAVDVLYSVIIKLTAQPRIMRLQMPTYTNMQGIPIMDAFPLALDKIATFTITEMDTVTGVFEAVDPADVFTAVSGDATNLNAVVGTNSAGAPALVVNWLHTTDPLLTGVVVTVSDSAGNLSDSQSFDMVAPADAINQISLDTQNVELADQPLPPA